jgi:hypothetical protein
MIIPSVPEEAWKISSAIFVNALLAFGLIAYAITNGSLDGFWFAWFGFVGLIAIGTITEYRWEIRPRHSELIRTLIFLGLIPLSSKRYEISDFSHIKRYVKRAWGYDSGNEGIYRPSIVLMERMGKELRLQQFVDCTSNEHPLSEAWAKKISEVSGLQVIDVIESWGGFLQHDSS